MADYRDLLRRAIDALPENNGNARRQVYDKARAALRKQLDAIQPELPSREKTHHRLQLEECIREVEQEATERMLSGLSQLDPDAFGAPADESEHVAHAAPEARAPAPVAPKAPEYKPPEPKAPVYKAPEPKAAEIKPAASEPPEPAPVAAEPEKPQPRPEPEARHEDDAAQEKAQDPVRDTAPQSPPETVLASATANGQQPAEPTKPVVRDAAPDESTSAEAAPVDPAPGASHASLPDAAATEKADDVAAIAPVPSFGAAPAVSSGTDFIPTGVAGTSAAAVEAAVDKLSGGAGTDRAEADVTDPAPVKPEASSSGFAARVSAFVPKFGASQKDKPQDTEPAMSAEREVDLDEAGDTADADPQLQIDHAIEILDREASGKGVLADPGVETVDPAEADIGFARAEAEDEGGGSPALTIFLILVLLLLAGGVGASYWAWREGYLDLSTVFGGNNAATVSEAMTSPVTETPPASTPAETVRAIPNGSDSEEPSRPGNTAAMPDVVETPATGLEQGGTDPLPADALGLAANTTSAPTPTMDGTAGEAVNTVAAPSDTDDKTDQRLPVVEDAPAPTEQAVEVANVAPEVVSEGSQSLLLEASDQANAGAVPYSGTVEWTRGVDEFGVPTLEGRADIPARNMSVNLLFRKNSDASLPASHIVEIDFEISDSFIGGGISRVAGILMKNEELVEGVPLVGASARVVSNNFLFALSASPADVVSNNALLKSRKWMDLAIIYSTGKQAILTLEKDDAATALFDDVIAVWSPADGATGSGG